MVTAIESLSSPPPVVSSFRAAATSTATATSVSNSSVRKPKLHDCTEQDDPIFSTSSDDYDDYDDYDDDACTGGLTKETVFSPYVSRRRFGRAAVAVMLGMTATDGRAALATATSTTTTTTTTTPPPLATGIREGGGSPSPLSPSQSSNPFSVLSDPTMDHSLTQFDTVNDVPAEYFAQQRSIYGFVERVIDGDTIRVRHIPGYGGLFASYAPPQPIQARGIANITLSIRIYGVDCPETGKNKRQSGQPYGEEAKQFTADTVYHRVVKITLLRRDQYNRAVSVVETVPRGLWESIVTGSRDLSAALARAGLAELYTGGGAEYYDRRDALEAAIERARREKRGIWSPDDDGNARQSAAEYKRQRKRTTSSGAGHHPTRGGGEGGGGGGLPTAATDSLTNTPSATSGWGTRRVPKVVATTNTNRATTKSEVSNRENLLDAVVTGLEFVG